MKNIVKNTLRNLCNIIENQTRYTRIHPSRHSQRNRWPADHLERITKCVNRRTTGQDTISVLMSYLNCYWPVLNIPNASSMLNQTRCLLNKWRKGKKKNRKRNELRHTYAFGLNWNSMKNKMKMNIAVNNFRM